MGGFDSRAALSARRVNGQRRGSYDRGGVPVNEKVTVRTDRVRVTRRASFESLEPVRVVS